jgi:hypothetical protein
MRGKVVGTVGISGRNARTTVRETYTVSSWDSVNSILGSDEDVGVGPTALKEHLCDRCVVSEESGRDDVEATLV